MALFDKESLLSAIVMQTALLYEVALQAPKKLGAAMVLLNKQDSEAIEACPREPDAMANEFLDWVYLEDKPKPDWVTVEG